MAGEDQLSGKVLVLLLVSFRFVSHSAAHSSLVIYLSKRKKNRETTIRTTQEIESFIRKIVQAERSLLEGEEKLGAVFLH